VTLYERVADLPLTVSEATYGTRERDTSSGFTRRTTTVELRSDGCVGRGEDVTYENDDHEPYPDPELAGEYTFDGFSTRLDGVDRWPEPPERDTSRHYRRWAFEAAALDLALRQADTDLANAFDRSSDPVRFAVSTRVESFERVERLLEVAPGSEFKLDPVPDWSDDLIERLADLDRVRVLDLKGFYEGTDVDTEPEPEFYRRVVEAFPDAVVEDPALTEETRPVFEGEEDRVAWDYPITGVKSVEESPWEPRWLNVKPSRFGTVRSLLDTVEYCRERDVRLYGGGQFELGVGRGQIQALASVFYPDAPNDVAPGGYNDPEPSPDLPSSPLDPPAEPVGFGW
jgi:hypothetical protein